MPNEKLGHSLYLENSLSLRNCSSPIGGNPLSRKRLKFALLKNTEESISLLNLTFSPLQKLWTFKKIPFPKILKTSIKGCPVLSEKWNIYN